MTEVAISTRVCLMCQTNKNLSEFSKNGCYANGSVKHHCYCKKCKIGQIRDWQRRNPNKVKEYNKRQTLRKGGTPRKVYVDFPITSLVCYQCKVEKPIEAFRKDRRNSAGYKYKCKECIAIREKEIRAQKAHLLTNIDI